MPNELSYNAKRMRIYRQNMTEEQKERRRAYQRAFYRANKERLLDYDREYRERKKLERKEEPRA